MESLIKQDDAEPEILSFLFLFLLFIFYPLFFLFSKRRAHITLPTKQFNSRQSRDLFLYSLWRCGQTDEGRGRQTSFQTMRFWAVSEKQEKPLTLTQLIHKAFSGETHSPFSQSANCAFLWFFWVHSAKRRLQRHSKPEKQKLMSRSNRYSTQNSVLIEEYNFSLLNPYNLSGFIILTLLQKSRYCCKYGTFFYTNRCCIHVGET